ncbi:cytochrome P450 [Saccharomonospora piscinae]|uniref:cytochrome P450 n=1 Tax=Saccharomonospora piscinae TaxID=687388 RepID=UPI0004648E25|nr:cytochrome P450 [Saccharomonospora piscinae]
MTEWNRASPELTLDARFHEAPHDTFAELRAEGGLHRFLAGGRQQSWLVVNYDDIRRLLRDHRLSKDPETLIAANRLQLGIGDDPEAQASEQVMRTFGEHLRGLLSTELGTTHATSLAGSARRHAERFLDRFAAGDDDDLLRGFALPYASAMCCELLGIAEDRHDEVAGHVRDMVLGGSRAANRALIGVLADTIVRLRSAPGADLLSALLARAREDSRLSDTTLLHSGLILITLAVETTFSFITTSVHTLLLHPESLAAIRRDPSLLDGAVEELLRYNGPHNISAVRATTAPVRVADTEIPEGQLVSFALTSGNRDPRQFNDPDRFDPTRDASAHLAFGHGKYRCLGAGLARLEAKVAIGTLLRRYPQLRIGCRPEELDWAQTPYLHSLRRLPVKLGARAGD